MTFDIVLSLFQGRKANLALRTGKALLSHFFCFSKNDERSYYCSTYFKAKDYLEGEEQCAHDDSLLHLENCQALEIQEEKAFAFAPRALCIQPSVALVLKQ